jgi:hypothetical protein
MHFQRAPLDARFPSSRTIRPQPPPPHIGPPLRTGEMALLRRPGEWFDDLVQVRGIDDDVALVRVKDHSEIVPLTWLRRHHLLR